MKSVRQHENIVAIIGHFTQISDKFMLLTEYCSEGNLLNYLRKFSSTPDSPDQILSIIQKNNKPNFFFNKLYDQCAQQIEINIDTFSAVGYEAISDDIKLAINRGYDLVSLASHDVTKCTETNFTNAKGMLSEDRPELTSMDLLLFAKQIATGMVSHQKSINIFLEIANFFFSFNHVHKK